MKAIVSRFIAILLLVVPGISATYGFLAMKDSLFTVFDPASAVSGFPWGKFILGFILFCAGVAFIGGWTFFRDRKRNYVAPRFRAKRKKR
ncbi:DUF2627 domain-containing protein [Paenibacillus allorhizosphaerae]|uniref:DUF2627 domain-containing protein n=1 Tax=Paenibacillus allorhizosphaerae TaxID=2849866 RepID=A0ABM8VHI9_9BACL|nr:DUF2627 domain-containing protein [Paenibacillus allorhizosphaerae]CAG7642038.1 hypothetical protein PAECIP111802_02807 [Paenibacillus allorhizosphaerae]